MRAQWETVGSTVPITSPAATRAPCGTEARTGSYVVRRSVPASSTDTTPLPATRPAKATRPAATARTGAPAGAVRSTPRWPRAYGVAGGSQPRTTAGRVPTGQ